VARAIRTFRESFPLVSQRLDEGISDELVERVRNGRIDVAFTRSPIADPDGLVVSLLLEEPLMLALPSEHALAGTSRNSGVGSLDTLEHAGKGVGRIERRATAGAALRLAHPSVTLKDGTAVVKDAEVVIGPGERVLVAGESGTGKSTLVRAIAGLWPWGNGHVEVEAGAKMLMVPQRACVPVGTLRRAVTYPLPAEAKEADEVTRALTLVGLVTWSTTSAKRRPGTRYCPAARSRGWHSRESCSTGPISSCSMRRHLRSILPARTGSWSF
jgi:DNA-binding transcriptional LysR family regulator